MAALSRFIITTMLSFVIRLVLTIGFAHIIGVDIIWRAFCAGRVIALIAASARYLQGGWEKKNLMSTKEKG